MAPSTQSDSENCAGTLSRACLARGCRYGRDHGRPVWSGLLSLASGAWAAIGALCRLYFRYGPRGDREPASRIHSRRQVAAIDDDTLTGDEAGRVGREKNGRADELAGMTEAAH